MKMIAEELGYSKSADYFEKSQNSIAKDINETLWCEDDGFYYDYVIGENRFHKVCSVASFLPIFAGVTSKK